MPSVTVYAPVSFSGAPPRDGRQFAREFQEKLASDIRNDRSPVTKAIKEKMDGYYGRRN